MDLEISIKKYESAVRVYRLLYTLFDFVTAFLTLYIIFSLTNMEDIFSIFSVFEPYTGIKYDILGFKVVFETLGIILVELIIALIITAIRYKRKEKKDAIKLIEENFPTLKERLRTAYDNRDKENIIVKDLLGGVIIDLKPIKPSSLLNKRLVIIGLGAMLLTGSGSTYIAVTDYHTDITPTDFSEVIENLPFSGSNSDIVSVEENGGTSSDPQDNSELFGEPAVIVVEGKDVDLKIPPGAGQGFTSQEEGEQNNESFIQSDIYNPEAIASQSYYENLPEGYRSVIQSYFEQLAEE
ncbi:DUF7502 family protein [Methanosarcina mazei]|uniref:Uncharacterized protein n=3 Tax=Methanosarcina mazei TaxID=2209 RepID=A0A0F8JGY8_METMZ|nr:hypothetical protein [Methanosarcina mazei]AAM30067.1 conserved protein [Methanosarcina mazei Go1]AKB64127.1 hypothetical protein MSMAS_0931 [Methanosarcina mazei S-6]KKG29029.1 hypothetical protein DU49_08520 [Methanosarcina mazei]KKG36981.1 hypothetical protein DU35_08605 [Methanosarcina mazei]KKG41929.1 hypothetical protein DU41_06860 [Methanosarcina mazei]